MGENFLQEDDHPRPGRRGDDLAAGRASGSPSPANARRVVDEVAERRRRSRSARCATSTSTTWSRDALVPRFREEPIAPLLGGLLAEVVRDDLHHGLVDLALDELHRWLVENPETVRRGAGRAGAVVGAAAAQRRRHRAGSTPSWSAGSRDIRDDPRHQARAGARLDARASSPTTCSTTPTPRPAPSSSRSGCSTTRRCVASSVSLWNALRRALQASLADPDGAVRAAAAGRARRLRRAAASTTPTCAAPRRPGRRRRGVRASTATAPSSPR